MAITLDAVKKILDNKEIKFDASSLGSEERPIITVGWKVSDPEVGEFSVTVIIILEEASRGGFEFVQIRAVKLVEKERLHSLAPDNVLELYKYMVYENYTNKIGTWCYDPSDGDIYLGAVISVEDGDVTEKQLSRVLLSIVTSAKAGYRDLRRIIEHGDHKKPLVIRFGSLPPDLLVKLTMALVGAGKNDLVARLTAYNGDLSALDQAVMGSDWERATSLLSPQDGQEGI